MIQPAPPTIAEVAVNAPLDRLFHYRIPENLRETLRRGHRVRIPFGRRTTTGVCVGFPEETRIGELKPIREILQPDCCFDAHLLELTRWIADYYFASWGEVLEAALPPGIRSHRPARKELLVEVTSPPDELLRESRRLERRARVQARVLQFLAENPRPHGLRDLVRNLSASRLAIRKLETRGFLRTRESEARDSPVAVDESPRDLASALGETPGGPELHPDQEKALARILAVLAGEHGSPPPPVLLHGITGSGKTEVYLRALRQVIREGGRGLVLVPEISLTPQTVNRFREGLPGIPVAVLHSLLTSRQRAAEWREIHAGRVGVVIGARSAVFSPVPDLKLIVIDEEHDTSYKQETSPRYHARDVAVLRAHLLKIPVLLGSATPSLESYQNARSGKYLLLELPRRVTRHDLPSVSIVPLETEFYRPDGGGLICGQLDFQIRQCLRRGDQVILFLNRRGFATFLHCSRCGFVLRCDFCDIALTYHRRVEETRCHYCDTRYTVPEICPECQAARLRRAGVGTEKVAEAIARRYEEARVRRFDRDVVKNQDALHSVLNEFSRGDADILVGTQMIAKGHDFPGVSLVGIISADTGLHFPDFRAAERTFQLITQVAGRAGRGEQRGRVIVQSFFPEHFAIQHATTGDYESFFRVEAEHRRSLGYPPFGRIAKVLARDSKPERAEKCARDLAARLREAAAGERGIAVLGPVEAPITRIQERHRFQILVKARAARPLLEVLRRAGIHRGGRSTTEVIVDVDPQTLL